MDITSMSDIICVSECVDLCVCLFLLLLLLIYWQEKEP